MACDGVLLMENLPTHVAIAPDGNRRWAQLHGASPLEGHQRGAEVMHQVVDYLADRGIKYLTLWGFSTDNWKRSSEEVKNIFTLLEQWIDSHTSWVHSKGIRLRHIGRLHELPEGLRGAINNAVTLTRNNSRLTLNVAFNYSGRAEILDAVRQLVDKEAPSQKIDEASFSRYLYMDGMPDVDLVIRTGGDFRISNFLLWQTAYSEYYFTEVLWPDFDTRELEKALQAYSDRKRRFGGD